MKNLINIKLLLGVLSFVSLISCYEDKGNYEYIDVNLFSVVNNADSVFSVTAKIDTVRISPKIKASLFSEEESPERYVYSWALAGKSIGTSKNLEYPVDIAIGTFKISLKVTDLKTRLIANATWEMKVSNLYATGYVVLSENENQEAQLDMVSIWKDTSVLLNVTSINEMPIVRNPKGLYMGLDRVDNEIHIIGENKVIKVNRLDFSYNAVTGNFRDNFAIVENLETFQVTQITNPQRHIGTVMNGDYYQTPTTGGILFGYPVNRYIGKYSTYKIAPQAAVNYTSSSYYGKAILYNTDEGRFTYYAGGFNENADSIKNTSSDISIFDWKPGLKFVGTYSTYFGTGDNFTLLTDGAGTYKLFHYRFTSSRKKIGCYDVSDAPHIAQAKFLRFSSKQPFFFYAAGTKVYGYDFMKNNRTVEIEMGAEVTCIYENFAPGNAEKAKDLIYIATYGGTPGSGKIIKKHIINDPDIIGLEDPLDGTGNPVKTEWTGLNKVIDILYR